MNRRIFASMIAASMFAGHATANEEQQELTLDSNPVWGGSRRWVNDESGFTIIYGSADRKTELGAKMYNTLEGITHILHDEVGASVVAVDAEIEQVDELFRVEAPTKRSTLPLYGETALLIFTNFQEYTIYTVSPLEEEETAMLLIRYLSNNLDPYEAPEGYTYES